MSKNLKSVFEFIQWFLQIAGVASLYYFAARLSLLLAFENTNASAVWPPSAIGFAAVLFLGYRVWPGIMFGAFLANIFTFWSNNFTDPIPVIAGSFLISGGNTLEAVCGVFLFYRYIGARNPLNRIKDVLKLILIIAAMCLVSPSIGATSLCFLKIVPWTLYKTAWFTWWIGDATGVLILAPLFFAFYKYYFQSLRMSRVFEMVAFFSMVIVLNWMVYSGQNKFSVENYPLAFIQFPLIVWAALRFSQLGMGMAILGLAGIAIWGTLHGFGPFVREQLNESLILVQAYVGVVTVTGVLLAASMSERRQTREILHKSKEELKDFLENAPFGLHWVGPDGVIQWANNTEMEILGYTPDEYIGHPIKEFYVNEDKIKDILGRLYQGQTIQDYEAEVRCKDGSVRCFLVSSNSLWEGGNFVHTRCFSRDITQSKEAQRILQEKEQWFQRLIENSSDIFTLIDSEGIIIYSSPSTTRLLGYPLHEYIGKKIFDFIHPEDLEFIYKLFAELLQKPRSFVSAECRYRHQNGSWRWLEGTGSNLLAEQGMKAVVINCRDITDRKHDQEERYRLAAVVDTSNDAIIAKTLDGVITNWNTAAERLYGYTASEVVGKSISILVPDGHEDEISNILTRLRRGEILQQIETSRRCKDGREIDVSLTISPIKNLKGKTIGASIIARDITSRKRADQQIQEAARLKSEFTSTVSHELRTPLAISQEAISLLLRGKVGAFNPKQSEILAMASSNLERLGVLINDILDFSKIEAGKMEIFTENTDVISLIRESCKGWKLKADLKKIKLVTVFSQKALSLSVDKVRFVQVLDNLLNNALKFTPEGGTVTVSVEERKECVKFSVQDTGPGIDAGDLPKLFKKFQQIKRAYGPGLRGTGLGLNIAKVLVELHNGQLSVESELGKGSTFWFIIPKTKAEVAR